MLCMSYIVAVFIVAVCVAIGALIVPPAERAVPIDKKKVRNQKILFSASGLVVGIAIVFLICMARNQ
jgi:predicted small lipoprotein YifL